jgi:hypothetical protein|tara:strand:- start:1025 stop:1828 length:804 start_codon:yes stop_codon:yes gene_type:complete
MIEDTYYPYDVWITLQYPSGHGCSSTESLTVDNVHKFRIATYAICDSHAEDRAIEKVTDYMKRHDIDVSYGDPDDDAIWTTTEICLNPFAELGDHGSAVTYSMLVNDDVCQLTVPRDHEIDLIVHTVGYSCDWNVISCKTITEAIQHMKHHVMFEIDHYKAYTAWWDFIEDESNGVEDITYPDPESSDLAQDFDEIMHPDEDTFHWYIGKDGKAGGSAKLNGPRNDEQEPEEMLKELDEFLNSITLTNATKEARANLVARIEETYNE